MYISYGQVPLTSKWVPQGQIWIFGDGERKNKESTHKENTGLFGNFSQHGGGGLPNSQNPKPKEKCL